MSLLLGVAAALVWGLHDLVVRIVSPRGPATPLLLVALAAGTLLLAPVAFAVDGPGGAARVRVGPAMLAGVAFACASLGLYRAFSIGPVRVVAPICGAYPVLSLAAAALQGRPPSALDWVGVLGVVAGLALAASRGEQEGGAGRRRDAVLWALLGAGGFATTFALAQAAAADGGELTVTLLARLAALLCVGAAVLAPRAPLARARALWRPLLLLGALDATAISLVVAAARLPSPEHAAVASSLFGLVTILLAWRLLGEPMRPAQWLGVLVVFGGIALVAA